MQPSYYEYGIQGKYVDLSLRSLAEFRKVYLFCFLFANREQKTFMAYLCLMETQQVMRPQDMVILLKLTTLQGIQWQYRDLAASLFISISEISASLNRSSVAGLYNPHTRTVKRTTMMEFIQFGLRYAFPQIPGAMVTGIPTAHSHPFYKDFLMSDQVYVWPYGNGTERGQAILPLHAGVPQAAAADPVLYKMLASIDVLRVGRPREVKLAVEVLKTHLLP